MKIIKDITDIVIKYIKNFYKKKSEEDSSVNNYNSFDISGDNIRKLEKVSKKDLNLISKDI